MGNGMNATVMKVAIVEEAISPRAHNTIKKEVEPVMVSFEADTAQYPIDRAQKAVEEDPRLAEDARLLEKLAKAGVGYVEF